jgi:hypothetical protein
MTFSIEPSRPSPKSSSGLLTTHLSESWKLAMKIKRVDDRPTGANCQVQQDLEQPQVYQYLGSSVRAPCYLGEHPDIAAFGKAIETMSPAYCTTKRSPHGTRALTDFHDKLANKAHRGSYDRYRIFRAFRTAGFLQN